VAAPAALGSTGVNSVSAQARFRYFAYGSNMLSRRLAAADRAPSAVPSSRGYVDGYRLTFHKVSVDGSGKCHAEATGRSSDRVHGVVFDVAWADKPALDRAEFLGRGYREETLEVVTPAGPVSATAYIATVRDALLEPYRWYKALVVAGAMEHGLPAAYMEWLRGFESIEDPDEDRRRRYEALLSDG